MNDQDIGDTANNDDAQPSTSPTNNEPMGGIFDDYINNDDLFTFLGASDPFMGNGEMSFDGLFVDYQPLFDFSGSEFNANVPG